MRVRVLFFGVLKDLAGYSAEEAEFPDGATVGDALSAYTGRIPRLGAMAGSLLLARNQRFAEPGERIEEGDELAFLPPVSGGSAATAELEEAGNYFALTRRPIDARRLAARLMTGAEGAVVTFEGTARNNTRGRRTLCLDYEAYEPMALREMARIGSDLAGGREIGRVAIAHRLGRILIGEASVVVVVTAPHRRPAFEAASEAIDRLKRTAPIWKKERFVDGETWVEGEPRHDAPR